MWRNNPSESAPVFLILKIHSSPIKLPIMDSLKYPIGPFEPVQEPEEENLTRWINDLSTFPGRLNKEVAHLDDVRLNTPYRKGGWTIRQVVHHLADSHINGYVRTKLAVTEDNPRIKTYDQDLWADLPDMDLPVSVSLNILDGIHGRWSALLESLPDAAFRRTIMHPESGELLLFNIVGMYAWHGNHHLGHITNLKSKENWE